ncbi:LOW QUALITY PROTEIN: hypothetical protein Cgig2_006043 [Carnegiea gigantea]|uniref:Uncharacterized protein n=1 Tax=Carnegiea gigantea TaxID=171969 RepID=A0A9Q1L0G8_9CARY|nr:LOW QUALITY PROTEIN: hypothetical protein Cgig2_006043 [Carnegiea gigantea]
MARKEWLVNGDINSQVIGISLLDDTFSSSAVASTSAVDLSQEVDDSLFWGRSKGQEGWCSLILGEISYLMLPVLLEAADISEGEQDKGERSMKLRNYVSASSYASEDIMMQPMEKETDIHWAHGIMSDGQCSMSSLADIKYNCDGTPTKKKKKKGAKLSNESDASQNLVKCIPRRDRPKLIVVAEANCTCLMLPQYQPVAPGHCCIVRMHLWCRPCYVKGVFNIIWKHLRKSSCLSVCNDGYSDIRLIILSCRMNSLQCARTNFPYFHVEFGLKSGFVDVIDERHSSKAALVSIMSQSLLGIAASTLQHEQGTRVLDDSVWEEIRNFKKCLILMLAKQAKEVIFLETQRHHCLIECIPLPQEIAEAAPLYFKKAIDEGQDEWSQHDAKKLIGTSDKGLRSSIPKNFPYFHVEFGLKKGFVHVIDEKMQFKSMFGLNVVMGMLQTQQEDMYRRRRSALRSRGQQWQHLPRIGNPLDKTAYRVMNLGSH